ncbi:MAG: tetratricopeptide repeat protein [Nitrospirales bacterium]
MNRADRRHQEKLQGRDQSRPASALKPLFDEAVAHHRAGRLDEAKQFYQQILAIDPHHAETQHLLGLIAYRTGELEEAVELLSQATRENQSQPTYWFNLGVVLQKQGKGPEALSAYEHALTIHPQYPEAHNNVGNVLMELGRLEGAATAYQRALRIRPEYVEAHNNLGVVLKEQGQLDEARMSCEEALRLAPNHLEAHCNLGSVLMDQGNLDQAVTCFERALQMKPEYVKALYHLAFALMWQKRFEEAITYLRRSADLKQNHNKPVTQVSVSRSRLKHDAEQVWYLFDRDRIGPEYSAYREALVRLRRRAAENPETAARMTVDTSELQAIASSFNRIIYYGDSPELATGAVNPGLDVPAIEARYHASRPEVMYLDGLLTQEALTSLRRFCLESTIWKRDYENGYLGAFLGDGFSCPLLLQIAEELRLKLPGIFQHHLLTQAWAFKYDSERTGLNIHADAAAVNVNFWVTPDEANLDPGHGGLVVWDREAPRHWNFKDYNNTANEPKVREFLAYSGAKAVAIPYRANRAVIFNSDLFHETDRFHFKDEYESRRLNITLLYGRRLNA